jgi:hypothetical protein
MTMEETMETVEGAASGVSWSVAVFGLRRERCGEDLKLRVAVEHMDTIEGAKLALSAAKSGLTLSPGQVAESERNYVGGGWEEVKG